MVTGPERVEVAIVGGGIGGLGLAARLRETGRTSFAVLEREPAVGGTWLANSYPGCACDVPSHLYSLSFAPNPAWTRRYPGRAEMMGYISHVVEQHGLREHLRLGTDVRSARFDGDARRWRIDTADGPGLEADVLVCACGQLRIPRVPDFPGLAEYAGATWHSARWDHDVALAGRRVAVIGSGASAIQVVPGLAGVAGRLSVFQRTPPWIIPRHDRPYSSFERRVFAMVPALRRAYRALLFGRQESLLLCLTPGSAAARAFTRYARWRLESQVADPALRAALLPDYPIGCKRILVSDDYYPALTRPDVELVTAGIERFTSTGIRTADGAERAFDAVVFATGFDSQALVAPMRIEGPDGVTLDTRWADGPQAHLGVTVAGMPNLFLLYGPNTNLGHNSIIYMIEAQIAHVLGLLDERRRRGAATVEVRSEVMERSNAELQTRLSGSVWAAGCTNWYQGAGGRITNNWPGYAAAYRRAVHDPDPAEFTLA